MYNKYLPVFLTIAGCGSFNKASEKLYVSPNAIMKQMNQFEQELGLKLFVRTHQGIQLTEEGELLYKKAQYIMAYSDAALKEIKELKKHKEEDIRIGVSALRNFKPLLNDIRQIRSLHKNWNLNVVSFDDEKTGYAKLISHLGEEIDCLFGLYSEKRMAGTVNIQHLTDYPICIAASVNHPLADRSQLTFSDLNGYSLIMVEQGDTESIDCVRQDIETNYPEINIINVPAYDVSTFNFCASINGLMISAGLWEEVHPLLVNIPLISGYTVPYGLICARRPTAQVQEFVQEIRLLSQGNDERQT